MLLDGQPLAEGTIALYDTAVLDDADVATITAGQFQGEATAGEKRVEINATRIVPGKMEEIAAWRRADAGCANRLFPRGTIANRPSAKPSRPTAIINSVSS